MREHVDLDLLVDVGDRVHRVDRGSQRSDRAHVNVDRANGCLLAVGDLNLHVRAAQRRAVRDEREHAIGPHPDRSFARGHSSDQLHVVAVGVLEVGKHVHVNRCAELDLSDRLAHLHGRRVRLGGADR